MSFRHLGAPDAREATSLGAGCTGVLLERIADMLEFGLGFDTETWLMDQGMPIPPLVVGSIAWLDPEVHAALTQADALERVGDFEGAVAARELVDGRMRIVGDCLSKPDTADTFMRALEDSRIILVGANIVMFDLLVLALYFAKKGIDAMPLIFKLLEEDRCWDIQLLEALHAVANGHLGKDPRTGGELINPDTGKPGMYALATITEQLTGRSDAKKNDEYKLRFREFDDLPLTELPEVARQYTIDDGVNTLEGGLIQAGHLPRVMIAHVWNGDGVCKLCGGSNSADACRAIQRADNICDLGNQQRGAFALKLGGTWGFRVNQSKVDIIERHARKKRERLIQPFITAKIIRPDGSAAESELKKLVAIAYGATEPCGVCKGTGRSPSDKQPQVNCPDCKARCQPWKSKGTLQDPTVESCARCGTTGKVNSPTVKLVGCHHPGGGKTCDATGYRLTSTVPRSESGEVSLSADSLNESGNEFLMSYGYYLEDKKILEVYIPYLRRARVPIAGHLQGCTINAKGKKKKFCPCLGPYKDIYLVLDARAILETGRVAYAGAIMLFPRWPGYWEDDEYVPSLRECIEPRLPSWSVVDVADDYQLQPGEEWV